MSGSKSKIKVLFMFSGLPHYYNAILNKLNTEADYEIHVLIPSGLSNNIGKGVHQTKENISFKIHHLKERKFFYSKTFFENFDELLTRERFNIIVTVWPYILGFIFIRKVRVSLQKTNSKLILKEIPFQVPKFYDTLLLKNFNIREENNPKRIATIKERLVLLILSFIRILYYKKVNAIVNYIEQSHEILSTYGVDRKKIFVTYNSHDTEKIFKVSKQASNINGFQSYNPQRILHVGRLVKWKRVELILEAVKKLSNNFDNIEAIMIGSGPEKDKLINLAENLGISERVKFVGSVYDPIQLAQYYHSSALYILAGMGGLSINEAMAFGKPIVCSVCDGTEKDLVIDGFNGRFFEEGDANDLAAKIGSILNDKNMIETMGLNSLSIIQNKININTVIEGYLRAFRFVLEEKQ